LSDSAYQKRDVNHSAESYFKDVDYAPPPDSTVHRVDSSSEAVQRPHDPPSGEWSRAGTLTEEYRHVDRSEPYDLASGSASKGNLRYGGKERYAQDKGAETSSAAEGPANGSASGRKPEGR